jgi:hypothetical protein
MCLALSNHQESYLIHQSSTIMCPKQIWLRYLRLLRVITGQDKHAASPIAGLSALVISVIKWTWSTQPYRCLWALKIQKFYSQWRVQHTWFSEVVTLAIHRLLPAHPCKILTTGNLVCHSTDNWRLSTTWIIKRWHSKHKTIRRLLFSKMLRW